MKNTTKEKKTKALIHEQYWDGETTYFIFPAKWIIDEDPIFIDGLIVQSTTGYHPDLDQDPIESFTTEKEAQEYINKLNQQHRKTK